MALIIRTFRSLIVLVMFGWLLPAVGSTSSEGELRGPSVPALVQSAYLKAINTRGGDEFGTSIAASGQTVLVGAQWENSAATGVDGDASDDSAMNAGAAYLFGRDPDGGWSPQAYLKATNTESGDRFGRAVTLSDHLAAVGAFSEDSAASGVNGDQSDNSLESAGAVYVYARGVAEQWAPEAYLKASNPEENDQFGAKIAMSGNTLVVGSGGEDSASAGIGGDQSDNSMSSSGAVYVFVRDGSGVWSQQAYIKASNPGESDSFGSSVAIDGDTLVVGAKFEDSNATGIDGDQSNNTATNAGAAYVFVRDAQGQWSQQAYLKASNTDANDQFGFSVAVSGDLLAVSAVREDSSATGANGDQSDNSLEWAGAVYIFERDANQAWSQQAYLKASNPDARDYFGESIGLSREVLIVGAWTEDSASTGVDGDQIDNSAQDAGAAYVFVRGPAGNWSQQAYLKAGNTDEGDWFGKQVAASGATLTVAADLESSSATGVGGDPSNNDVSGSGAAYVFTLADRSLTVARSGQGQVTSDPAGIECPAACDASFPYDIAIELTATPAPGWRFDQWSGDCSGSSCQVQSDDDRQVIASFIRLRNLQITVKGEGRITSDPTGIDCGDVCQAAFDDGVEVTLNAQAEPGWALTTWGGAASACGDAKQCTITLDQNRSVGALFEQIEDRIFTDRFRQDVE